MNKHLVLITAFSIVLLPAGRLGAQAPDSLPNILLIVADDLGYSDLGCFAGEIATPNIDKLAEKGVRFSRFHTAPMCAPTRAMILTGNDNHIAGIGEQGVQRNEFGYEGYLTQRVATVPEVLQAMGYYTIMAGKWHLGMRDEHNPHARGFDRSFVLLHGAGNHYDAQGLFESYPTSHYTENGKPADWPFGAYSTDFYTDKLIEYLELRRGEGKPFFAFAAYTSPHWPLQVDEKYWKEYEGKYDDGYEALRTRRFEALKNEGFIPAVAAMPPMHESVKPWNDLGEDERRYESRKMELYAGMVANLDYNVGRLIDYLVESGKYENTLIIFMSDNGAAGNDFFYDETYGPFIRQYFTDAYEAMGQPNSFISYGPPWAEAGSAPFRYFKGYSTEGGIVAPLIISGPMVENQGTINHEFITVTDLAPTIYESAGTEQPAEFNGRQVFKGSGRSAMPVLAGTSMVVHSDSEIWALEHMNHSLVIRSNWKLTHHTDDGTNHVFGLYNLADDPGETRDLKEKLPGKFEEMHYSWQQFIYELRIPFRVAE